MVFACGTSSDHVRFEKGTFNNEILVKHGLHHCAEDKLGDACALFDRVGSVSEDLRLDDGHKTVVLADGTIAGEGVSSLTDAKHAWAATADLEDGSPLGEAATFSIEGGGAAIQTVKTLSGLLTVGASDINETLVELDASVDTSGAEELNKVLTFSGGLINCLLEHDHTRDVCLDAWSLEEKLTVSTSVGLGVLNFDWCEARSDGASGFVSSEDTFARGADSLGGGDELILELSFGSLCLDHDVFVLRVFVT